jgi:hypothetical protein
VSYYQGDFYQGDPGFFSVIGKLGKAAFGMGKSLLGLPAAGAGKIVYAGPGVGTTLGKIAKSPIVQRGVRAIVKHPVLSAAGAAGAIGMMGAGAGAAIGRRGMVAGGGRRRRRMNVTNVRALRRSIRRTQGFAKLAMRTIHLVHPKKKARFGGFKKRRRKAA